MTGHKNASALKTLAAIGATALLLGGCSWDYLNHEDRVSYKAGNAVKANLARETTNPSKKSQNDTSGLGKNGDVIPDDSVLTP